MYFEKIESNNKQGFKWICIGDGPPDPVTGKRTQIKRRGDSKKEASARVKQAVDLLVERGINEKKLKAITFEIVAQDWLGEYSRGKKNSTIRVRKNEISTLDEYMAKTNIDKISTKGYQRILNDLSDKGRARSTVEGVHVTAGMIMKYALKEKYIKDNPCSGAVIPSRVLTVEDIERNPIEDGYLERKEITEFLEAVKAHGLEYDVERFYLLAFTGMRSGELCALKWTDVDFERNTIRITKTLYNPNNNMIEFEITPPKTAAAIRTVDVNDKIITALKELHSEYKVLKQAVKELTDDRTDDDFIFCRENGTPYIQKSIINRMQRILDKTSITKKATPHIFRHTHISMMAEAGVDITTIMKRVGHDDMKTTLTIYTHVTDKMKSDAADKVNTHFQEILQF
ncbi:tyrosine-type recombinase/integrase [Paenibacillus sinopodophylli]|uniref:tyrosine-type recombinase/integrase n=1 Tax=Paenibacillus sinopodophylli TaxID=1837342 RepID=UPI00110C9768|nr:site-specific integrase [Paenibacillus sinopodophylli]